MRNIYNILKKYKCINNHILLQCKIKSQEQLSTTPKNFVDFF